MHLSGFDDKNNPVIVLVNCATRGPEGCRRIETTDASRLQKNPDIDETRRLQAWFDSTGRQNVNSFKKSSTIVNETTMIVRAIDTK